MVVLSNHFNHNFDSTTIGIYFYIMTSAIIGFFTIFRTKHSQKKHHLRRKFLARQTDRTQQRSPATVPAVLACSPLATQTKTRRRNTSLSGRALFPTGAEASLRASPGLTVCAESRLQTANKNTHRAPPFPRTRTPGARRRGGLRSSPNYFYWAERPQRSCIM